jgi:hypothetical protein
MIIYLFSYLFIYYFSHLSERGQTYALDILNDLNAGASGWVRIVYCTLIPNFPLIRCQL